MVEPPNAVAILFIEVEVRPALSFIEVEGGGLD
jgi:hypothetical protein